MPGDNYLKVELYDQVEKKPAIFEFLQSGSLDGICYWDLEQPENERMSPRFWETLGYDPTSREHTPSEWQDVINQDDLAIALDNFKKHCADPSHPYDQSVRYLHADGSTVWVRCRGLAIRDDAGNAVRMLDAHTDITAQLLAEDKLRATQKIQEQEAARYRSLPTSISSAHLRFNVAQKPADSFNVLLDELLEATGSEYGVIGEVPPNDRGEPFLKTHAITNITWNAETRDFYARNAPEGLEFFNLESLFGKVLTTREAVIANDAPNDSRRGGVPGRHPPLNAFLGLPFHYNNQMVGMVGIANKPGGYDDSDVEFLQPLTLTCAHLVTIHRQNRNANVWMSNCDTRKS